MRRSEFLTNKREFHELTAAVLMEKDVVSCRPKDSERCMAAQLTKFNIGSMPVVGKKGMLVGLVSEFDLLRVLRQCRDLKVVKAEEIMTRDLKTVQEDTPVDEAIGLLEDKQLIRVPVVKDGRLIGILARRDILFGYFRTTGPY